MLKQLNNKIIASRQSIITSSPLCDRLCKRFILVFFLFYIESFAPEIVTTFVTHTSIASFLWDIGKPYSPRCGPQNLASQLGLSVISSKNEIQNVIPDKDVPLMNVGSAKYLLMTNPFDQNGLRRLPWISDDRAVL